MSEEEKEAIENLGKELKENIQEDNKIDNYKYISNLYSNGDIEVVLNLIDKQQKVIDLMVKEIATAGKSIEIINLYNNVSPDRPIYDLVKEYFYKKAEE